MGKRLKREISVTAIYMGKTRQPGACEIYRGNMPLYFLGQQPGWTTRYGFIGDIYEKSREERLRLWYNLISQTDVFVFPRMYLFHDNQESVDQFEDLYDLLRGLGKKIVYETDDDYTNKYRDVTNGGNAIYPAQLADAVTVSTPYLANTYRRITKRPVHVLPNCIDPALWRDANAPSRVPETRDKIIVSLTGSETHQNDWAVLSGVMPRILDECPNVHFIVMGYHPDYLAGLPNTTYLPGVKYEQYSQIIRGSDVILAPVDPDDGFNLGKSAIKATEGQAAQRTLEFGVNAGAAVIATDNPVYRLAIKHETTGLLAQHTPDGWYEAIHRIVTDHILRHQLQINGHRWVYKHHDISKEWRQWARVYRKVVNEPSKAPKILSHSKSIREVLP